MTTRKNACTKMLNYLRSGYDITTKQAQERFGIQNVGARVYDLREEGYPVYTNRKMINGEKVRVYRLGTFPKAAKTPMQRRAALKRLG